MTAPATRLCCRRRWRPHSRGRPAFFVALLGAATLAACALNPLISQIDDFEKARAAGRWQEIADAAPRACEPGETGCARLYAIHAEANHRLAFASRAPTAVCPGPAATPRLQRADDGFARALQFTDRSLSAADLAKLRELRTQALYCLAENAATIGEGVAFARQAKDLAMALPRAPSLLWQAMAQLYLARPGAAGDIQRCQAAKAAAALAGEAQALDGGENSALLARIAHDSALRQASISGCGG